MKDHNIPHILLIFIIILVPGLSCKTTGCKNGNTCDRIKDVCTCGMNPECPPTKECQNGKCGM